MRDMNNNPYDQNQKNTSSSDQNSFNNNPYAQYENDNPYGQSSDDCGYGNRGEFSPNVSEDSGKKGLAIASLVLGIVSLCCCCSSYICGILAIVFGIIARKCEGGSGASLGGIICGSISVALTTLMFIVMIAMGMTGYIKFEVTEMSLFLIKTIV
ncbi:MAG: DUF4190 domain-containing protein [Ruminococcaceae bacterium]|nr:DUF4190 domain-containing protein [Oscillospiraceae bacterium]